MVTEILKTEQFEGYEVRTEKVTLNEGEEPVIVESAYTPEGHYIGRPADAHFLITGRGIKPELRTEGRSVCSIGFCEKEQRWYGWSHRAIAGFGVGSKVTGRNHVCYPTLAIGFEANSLDDARLMAQAFAEAVS